MNIKKWILFFIMYSPFFTFRQNLFLWTQKSSPEQCSNMPGSPGKLPVNSTASPPPNPFTLLLPVRMRHGLPSRAFFFLSLRGLEGGLAGKTRAFLKRERRAFSWREERKHYVTDTPRKERNLRNGYTSEGKGKHTQSRSIPRQVERAFRERKSAGSQAKIFPPNPYLVVDWGKSRLIGKRCCLETNTCGEFL